MEARLKQNQLYYFFENMEDGVCITGSRGEVRFMNPAAERILGIPAAREKKELIIWEAIPFVRRNDAFVQLFIDALTEEKTTKSALVEFERQDGSVHHLRISITCSEERVFAIVISDLTELVRVNSAFERYTSPAIAEYVLETPGGELQGGAEWDVTILMSDLRGFTAISEKLQPSQLIRLLNHYFERMVEAIGRWQGTVIEFLGDGIFAVFGAPKADEEHAAHAVACAVEMQNAMLEVNDWCRREGFPTLEMGIGINSGRAVVGNIGSERKMKYGCIGETVNVAGRVESLTIGGQILAADGTVRRIREKLCIADERVCRFKGTSAEHRICDIRGIGGAFLRVQKPDAILWRYPSEAPAVKFRLLEEKVFAEESLEGEMTGISGDGDFGLLRTETALEPSVNLVLDIRGQLDAKVIGPEEGAYRICFTSKPDGFKAWVEEHFGPGASEGGL